MNDRTNDDRDRAERRRQLHDLERDTARRGPDAIHVLRLRYREDRPATARYYLARWSLIARLRRDAEGSGDELADLGPEAMLIAHAAQRGDFGIGALLLIGVADGDRWAFWNAPYMPVEPVPGSRRARAWRN